MDIKISLAVLVLKLFNVIDVILQKFGIKLCKITKESLLEGFPEEIYDEINQPDIKFLFHELMKAMEKDTEMHFMSRYTTLQWMKGDLKQRLLLRKTLEEIPEILQIPVTKPLFIVGPPRTGTTFLNWLLSSDKQFRSPMLWEFLEPCPPGNPEDYTKDPKYQRAVQAIEFRKASLSRRAYAAHASEPDKPEECVLLQLKSFYNIPLRFPIDSMDEYCKIIDNLGGSDTAKHVYRYYKKNLQVLAYDHDMENKRYLLKAPNHLLHIDAILDVFPDSSFIFTHRRLSEIIPSFFSLNLAVIEQFGGTPDIKWKKRLLRCFRAMLVSGLKSIERLDCLGSKNPVYSMPYTDLIKDPLQEMRKMYDYFGMALTPKAESVMRDYMENDPKKTSYGTHKYTLEEFGLTMDDLKEEFKEYIDMMLKTTQMKDIV